MVFSHIIRHYPEHTTGEFQHKLGYPTSHMNLFAGNTIKPIADNPEQIGGDHKLKVQLEHPYSKNIIFPNIQRI